VRIGLFNGRNGTQPLFLFQRLILATTVLQARLTLGRSTSTSVKSSIEALVKWGRTHAVDGVYRGVKIHLSPPRTIVASSVKSSIVASIVA